MEQEPIYVPSNKLTKVCHAVLGWILDYRQTKKEAYVLELVHRYNAKVARSNRWRKWFDLRPRMFITPIGMEMAIKHEVDTMADPNAHPMIQIHREYGNIEHEAKDTLIACKMVDAVAISGSFCRAISHMGVDLTVLHKEPFGFGPRNK